jgi:hypothetical protein
MPGLRAPWGLIVRPGTTIIYPPAWLVTKARLPYSYVCFLLFTTPADYTYDELNFLCLSYYKRLADYVRDDRLALAQLFVALMLVPEPLVLPLMGLWLRWAWVNCQRPSPVLDEDQGPERKPPRRGKRRLRPVWT